ncbi:MAG: response regulator [Lachnospiraceae bacterium]|nr:response regulator [Lachnospiraceae bacterium]
MDNKLLLISRGSTFMVDALANGLAEVGIEVIKAEPKMSVLEQYKEEPNVVLFYMGNYLEEIADVLVYLKDLCVEKDKILCTIGDAEEFETLCKSISSSYIKEHFERPLNVKDAAEKMQFIFASNDERARRKRILLVDDDAAYLTMAKSWLEEDYRVVVVNSGMQAITYLANNVPDLILLDYEMPVTTGPQVLEMIRSEIGTSGIPVFFLTAKGDKESVMKVVSLKPNGYLLKTMKKEELLKTIGDFFMLRKG